MRKVTWLICALMMALPALAVRTTVKAATTADGGGEDPPTHPVTVAQVRELMELTGSANLQGEMVDGMLPSLQQMMPYMPASVIEDFRTSLRKTDFEPVLVRTYQQHLSTEDAARIIAFYKTPAGRRMITTMPQITEEGQQAGAELGQQVMLGVIQRHQAEIEAAARSYHTQHPGASAPGVQSQAQP